MAEQKNKKPGIAGVGYFLIIGGIVGIVTRFVGGFQTDTISLIKLGVSVVILIYGITTFFRKKKP